MKITRVVITSDTHNLESPDFWKRVATESPDAVLHGGDWTCTGLHEGREAFERMRTHYKGMCIGVLGNHDYWKYEEPSLSWMDINDGWTQLANEYNVHLLNGGSWKLNDIWIAGLTGWYKDPYPYSVTQDYLFMREDVWRKAQKMADGCMSEILVRDTKIDILLTHFEVSTTTAKLLCNNTKRIVLGHWHKPLDAEWFGMRVLNVGSNYHEAKFAVLDL